MRNIKKRNYFKLILPAVLLALVFIFFPTNKGTKAQTVCMTAPTNTGVVTLNTNVASAGTYKMWSRVMVTGDSANSYILQVDNNCPEVIGDLAGMTTNVWIWVDFTNGINTSKYTLPLTAGAHSIKLFGKEAGIKVDKLLITSDLACSPSGLGENCTKDTVAPNVSITSPTSGTTVSGMTSVNITATDDRGVVSKVELYVDGSLKGSTTTSPFIIPWDSSTATDGSHSLTAKAYDPDNNNKLSSAVQVTKAAPVQAEISFKPSDDSYIRNDLPNNNYGGVADLQIDNDPAIQRALFKFNIAGIGSKQVIGAKLRLFNTNYSAQGGEVHLLTNNNWNESAVNWSNAPAFSTNIINKFDIVHAGNWYDVDVTSAVKADGTLGFMLLTTASDGAFYGSKESANSPQLIVSVK